MPQTISLRGLPYLYVEGAPDILVVAHYELLRWSGPLDDWEGTDEVFGPAIGFIQEHRMRPAHYTGNDEGPFEMHMRVFGSLDHPEVFASIRAGVDSWAGPGLLGATRLEEMLEPLRALTQDD